MDKRTEGQMDNFKDLLKRTKQFALRVMKLADSLPTRPPGRTIANQIVRSGTSVFANYSAAQHARSHSEFISKIGIVVEEMDETLIWLDLTIESGLIKQSRLEELYKESKELLSIFCAIQKSSRINKKAQQ
ncbi:MAG: four helix bundle protein [Rickettsiales bacterium]|jgi:four helix bundle protein|nr:four helix bundle protein [Rickettsiales bacterium]